ncbi:hypothetical protein F5B18DRAFT_631039 [Nemania serpens]|nr:hypothetical protein F5B18DRAFT_631039 [Nemania serpens]
MTTAAVLPFDLLLPLPPSSSSPSPCLLSSAIVITFRRSLLECLPTHMYLAWEGTLHAPGTEVSTYPQPIRGAIRYRRRVLPICKGLIMGTWVA